MKEMCESMIRSAAELVTVLLTYVLCILYCVLLCTRNTEEWWMRTVISLWPISCQLKRLCKREKTTKRFKFLTVMVKSECVLLPSGTSGAVYLYAVHCLQV